MTADDVARHILQTFPEVQTTDAFGFTFYFVAEQRMMPFATIGHRDNEGDRVSNLDREGVYRLSVGVSRQTFELHAAGKTNPDFTALDIIMPHPDYAKQHWLC